MFLAFSPLAKRFLCNHGNAVDRIESKVIGNRPRILVLPIIKVEFDGPFRSLGPKVLETAALRFIASSFHSFPETIRQEAKAVQQRRFTAPIGPNETH